MCSFLTSIGCGVPDGVPRTEPPKTDSAMTSEHIFLRNQIRFHLKNATFQFSSIRMRMRVNGERLTFFLSADFKLRPCHWDKEAGYAITDPKRNKDIKGNPMLQQTLYNINREIDRTAAATIKIIEDARLHGDTLTVA